MLDMASYQVRPGTAWRAIAFRPDNYPRWLEISPGAINKHREQYDMGVVELAQRRTREGFVLLAVDRKTLAKRTAGQRLGKVRSW